jgi:hypothetical protein
MTRNTNHYRKYRDHWMRHARRCHSRGKFSMASECTTSARGYNAVLVRILRGELNL